jgi:hypothetical protein
MPPLHDSFPVHGSIFAKCAHHILQRIAVLSQVIFYNYGCISVNYTIGKDLYF